MKSTPKLDKIVNKIWNQPNHYAQPSTIAPRTTSQYNHQYAKLKWSTWIQLHPITRTFLRWTYPKTLPRTIRKYQGSNCLKTFPQLATMSYLWTTHPKIYKKNLQSTRRNTKHRHCPQRKARYRAYIWAIFIIKTNFKCLKIPIGGGVWCEWHNSLGTEYRNNSTITTNYLWTYI